MSEERVRDAQRPDVASTTIALAIRSAASEAPSRSAALWSPLAAVRAAIDAMFTDIEAEVLDAVRMTAGELGENVLKYGEEVGGIAGHITVSRTRDSVEIRTVNRLTDATRAAHLSALVERITNADDLRSPYVDRMLQIVEEPNQRSTALGLLRVGYEGLFELSCSHDGVAMTVIAARSIR